MPVSTHSLFCQIWWIFLPVYHRPSKMPNLIFFVMFLGRYGVPLSKFKELLPGYFFPIELTFHIGVHAGWKIGFGKSIMSAGKRRFNSFSIGLEFLEQHNNEYVVLDSGGTPWHLVLVRCCCRRNNGRNTDFSSSSLFWCSWTADVVVVYTVVWGFLCWDFLLKFTRNHSLNE